MVKEKISIILLILSIVCMLLIVSSQNLLCSNSEEQKRIINCYFTDFFKTLDKFKPYLAIGFLILSVSIVIMMKNG
jgi:hypothetical protein